MAASMASSVTPAASGHSNRRPRRRRSWSSAEPDGGVVVLVGEGEVTEQPGAASDADHQHAGGHRVERAGMADLAGAGQPADRATTSWDVQPAACRRRPGRSDRPAPVVMRQAAARRRARRTLARRGHVVVRGEAGGEPVAATTERRADGADVDLALRARRDPERAVRVVLLEHQRDVGLAAGPQDVDDRSISSRSTPGRARSLGGRYHGPHQAAAAGRVASSAARSRPRRASWSEAERAGRPKRRAIRSGRMPGREQPSGRPRARPASSPSTGTSRCRSPGRCRGRSRRARRVDAEPATSSSTRTAVAAAGVDQRGGCRSRCCARGGR